MLHEIKTNTTSIVHMCLIEIMNTKSQCLLVFKHTWNTVLDLSAGWPMGPLSLVLLMCCPVIYVYCLRKKTVTTQVTIMKTWTLTYLLTCLLAYLQLSFVTVHLLSFIKFWLVSQLIVYLRLVLVVFLRKCFLAIAVSSCSLREHDSVTNAHVLSSPKTYLTDLIKKPISTCTY